MIRKNMHLLAISMLMLTTACVAEQETPNTEQPSPLRSKTELEQAVANAFVKEYEDICKIVNEATQSIERKNTVIPETLQEIAIKNFCMDLARRAILQVEPLSLCIKWQKNPLQNPEEEAECRENAHRTQNVYTSLSRLCRLERDLKAAINHMDLYGSYPS